MHTGGKAAALGAAGVLSLTSEPMRRRMMPTLGMVFEVVLRVVPC